MQEDNKALQKKVRYDWNELSESSGINERFTITVTHRFQAIATGNEMATSYIATFIKANEETAKGFLPK